MRCRLQHALVGDVDDGGSGRRLGGEVLRQHGRRLDVDPELPVPDVPRQASEVVLDELAGIVHQQGQRCPESLCRGGDERIDLGWFGEVCLHDRRAPAAIGDGGCESPGFGDRAVGVDRHGIAGVGQRLDDGATDPLGTSGDQRCAGFGHDARPSSFRATLPVP